MKTLIIVLALIVLTAPTAWVQPAQPAQSAQTAPPDMLDMDGIAYQAGFDTVPDDWRAIRIRFADCRPTFRGRRMPDAPPLDGQLIQQIGFMIADRQQGRFQLENDWIRAYKDTI